MGGTVPSPLHHTEMGSVLIQVGTRYTGVAFSTLQHVSTRMAVKEH